MSEFENMSFEERLSNTVLMKRRKPKENTKRANKNRPREVSSKIKPKTQAPPPKKETRCRDPRFDSLCGDFNEKSFKESYSFLDEIKEKEAVKLRRSLRTETDPERKERIKQLLKKQADRSLEKKRLENLKKKNVEHVRKVKESIQQGKKARFRNKAEKQLSELVEKYEELKSKGKVEKYLAKKSKKLTIKEKRENHGF